MTSAAPSEEIGLLCDIPGCESSLSLISGVDRSEHGWGRITVYQGLSGGSSFPMTCDYDLCTLHNRALNQVLQG